MVEAKKRRSHCAAMGEKWGRSLFQWRRRSGAAAAAATECPAVAAATEVEGGQGVVDRRHGVATDHAGHVRCAVRHHAHDDGPVVALPPRQRETNSAAVKHDALRRLGGRGNGVGLRRAAAHALLAAVSQWLLFLPSSVLGLPSHGAAGPETLFKAARLPTTGER